jgi:hypothetical protein
MEGEYWCELLRVEAIPHIFEAGDASATLPIEGFIPHVLKDGVPTALGKQLESLQGEIQKADKVDYLTIFHAGKDVITQDTQSYYTRLELMLQPYVFYDAREHKDYDASVKSAIYTLDNDIGRSSIKSCPENIQINPKNIYDCNVNIKIDSQNKKLPSNTVFELSLCFPVQVFYILTLVPYGPKIARVLICKNVIVFNDSNEFGRIANKIAKFESYADKIDYYGDALRVLSSINPRVSNFFDSEVLQNLSHTLVDFNLNEISILIDRFYYYIYEYSGRPQGDPNFGRNQYERLYMISLAELTEKSRWNWATEFLNKCFDSVILEILQWIRQI